MESTSKSEKEEPATKKYSPSTKNDAFLSDPNSVSTIAQISTELNSYSINGKSE